MTNNKTFRTPYDAHKRFHPNLTGKSLTHQSMAPECDINSIMRKYEKTGILEHRNNFEGQYGDFSEGPADYHASMNAVIAAEEMFLTLPARLRRRFHNDPGAFLDYVGNPENAAEMVSLGLATLRQEDVLEPQATPPAKKETSPSKPPSGGSTAKTEKPSED